MKPERSLSGAFRFQFEKLCCSPHTKTSYSEESNDYQSAHPKYSTAPQAVQAQTFILFIYTVWFKNTNIKNAYEHLQDFSLVPSF